MKKNKIYDIKSIIGYIDILMGAITMGVGTVIGLIIHIDEYKIIAIVGIGAFIFLGGMYLLRPPLNRCLREVRGEEK